MDCVICKSHSYFPVVLNCRDSHAHMVCAPCAANLICVHATDAFAGSGLHYTWRGLRIKCPICRQKISSNHPVVALLPHEHYDKLMGSDVGIIQQLEYCCKCPHCSEVTASPFYTAQHILTNCKRIQYKCGLCGMMQQFVGNTKDAFEKHMETCPGRDCPRLSCDFVGNKDEMLRHLGRHEWADSLIKRLTNTVRMCVIANDSNCAKMDSVVRNLKELANAQVVSDLDMSIFKNCQEDFQQRVKNKLNQTERENDDDDNDDDDDDDDENYIPSSSDEDTSSEEDNEDNNNVVTNNGTVVGAVSLAAADDVV